MFSSAIPSDAPISIQSRRRETVFVLLSGIFLGTLAILNLLGITRFVDLSFTVPFLGLRIPMLLAVGTLPYPITFLCTDFLSEFYGERRANTVVLVGLLLNLWVLVILWLGGVLPGAGTPGADASEAFFTVRRLAFGAVAASMIAYLAAQLADVHLFHFWKRLTGGRHLWLRNNGSTMVSQMIDTVSVILITHFYAHALPVDPERAVAPQLAVYILSGYVFKFAAALLDTVPFYLGVRWLRRYLDIDSRTRL